MTSPTTDRSSLSTMPVGPALRRLSFAVISCGFLSCTLSVSALAANSPQLELFPVSVQESFKQAESETLQMQSELSRISKEMKIQEDLYKESKCDQLSDDAGCRQLKAQMRDKFMELNTAVQQALPEVKRAVKHAHKKMGASLNNIANKYTPSELVKLNHKAMQRNQQQAQHVNTARTPLGRMASLFAKINRSIGSKQTNLYVLASQTYTDLTLINNELELLEQNTANNAIVTSLGIDISDMNEEEMETISNFRARVMGDDVAYDTPVYMPQNSTQNIESNLSKYY